MRTILSALLVILTWLGGAQSTVHAATLVVDGPSSCLAIGGEWVDGCVVHHLVIQADDTLVVVEGLYFSTDGPVYNYGRIEMHAGFQPLGRFINRGTLITYGITVPGDLVNSSVYINRGWLHIEGGLRNDGSFENEGTVETCAGAIINRGYMHNANYVANWGTLIVNEGIFVNDNYVHNPPGDIYRILNSGAFENRGILENEGTFTTACGGAFYGNGGVSGLEVRYDECEPAVALQVLTARVIEAGPVGSRQLTKADVQALGASLANATKELSVFGDRAAAAAQVRRFVEAVGALRVTGRPAPHVAAAFVGWADRVIQLLEP